MKTRAVAKSTGGFMKIWNLIATIIPAI